jgi:hypothetical protein
VGNKKALIILTSPAHRKQVGAMRAHFCRTIRAYHYLTPLLKVLTAPTPISPLVEHYILLLIVVKLFLGFEYIGNSKRDASYK